MERMSNSNPKNGDATQKMKSATRNGEVATAGRWRESGHWITIRMR